MSAGRLVIAAVALAGVAAAGGWYLWGRGGEEDSVRERGLRDYRCDQPAKVYLGGMVRVIRRPMSVDSSQAYARIPEYARIRNEGISADTPLYTLLMKAATDRFVAAVTEVARAHDHDVVAEKGAIHCAGPEVPEVPDRTPEVLAALAR